MARQPGTGLERATKSIPLSGGITEEVDDFLLEPGGMQYMENLRFTKKDVAEKARGRATGVSTGVTNHTDDVYGFWSQGNTVAVVGNDKVGLSRDAGATFETTAQYADLMGIERILSTAEASGGNNYSWSPVANYTASTVDTLDITGYCVAFERVTHLTGTITNSREVIVHVYDLEGQLNEETIFTGAACPKVHPYDGGACVTFVAGGAIKVYTVGYGDLTIGSIVDDDSVGVQGYCQNYNDTDQGYGQVGTVQDFNEMRLGYSRDLRANNYAMDSFHRYDNFYGCRAWKDGTGNIKMVRTILGVSTGSTSTVVSDTATTFHRLLDCFADDSYMWCLYSACRANTSAIQTDLFLTRMNLDITSPSTKTLTTNHAGEAINGSARSDGNGDVNIAVTFAAGDPMDMQYATAVIGVAGHPYGVYWWELDSDHSTINDTGKILGHRLCSDIAIDKYNYPYACMQQWENWNTGEGGTAPNDVNSPVLTATHKKPVTTVLVRLNQSNQENLVIATFDAGQSKACLAGSDEQSMHMSGELYYFSAYTTGAESHTFYYGNRVMLGATDDFFYQNTTTDRAFPSSDGRASLHAGAARFSCYKLAQDLEVNSVNFTNGMFMGTAIPTWFDGSTTICSMQPIDSPEVVGWSSSDGDAGGAGTYQDMVIPGAEGKMVNVVTGYYDDAGLIHRSAPSLDFYLSNMKATTTTSTRMKLYVTPPLGLARGRKYFIEVYEAWPGGTPQLAATKHVSTNDASAMQSVEWATNLSPQTTEDLDVADFRAAKTIYTAGNVLAADPWPNFDLVVKSGRRLFAHSISDPATVYYSKTFESGVAPEFSAALTVSIGNEKITAMGAIDDKVLLFTATGVWLMYGTGPDNTGANGDFFIEQMVYPVGCTDQQSIITYEQGIAFYSSTTEEFHVFTRDLQLKDVGDAVKVMSESITDVVTSIVVPNDHEIRWYCTRTVGPKYVADSATNSPPQPPRPFIENQAPAGSIFVYNYKYQKWSIIEDAAVRTQRAIISNNSILELADDWDVYPLDNSSWDKLCKWETPWIKVNQLQDFGRFYGLTFLGKYMSSWSGTPLEAGDLQVTIRYDYEGALGDTDVHRERANVDFDPADGDRLQFRVRPKRQKCQAIKIEIEEVATTAVELWEPTYTTGQGFILTGVDVHYGAKGGSGDKSLGSSRRKG